MKTDVALGLEVQKYLKLHGVETPVIASALAVDSSIKSSAFLKAFSLTSSGK